ncbi:hypothetical protein ABZY42_21065 [Streptomyces sp. NPDC006622]|uniref:hypothetical protein n=1 Tax=Streptomyces sp. NPDC006622 TaxID=3155459 RepID=UPI0033AA920D
MAFADIHDQLVEHGMEGWRPTRVAGELGIDADPKAIGPRLLLLLTTLPPAYPIYGAIEFEKKNCSPPFSDFTPAQGSLICRASGEGRLR